MLLFLSFFVSVRSDVMFHGLEQYFIRDSEENIVSFISISASPSECCITEKRERNQIKRHNRFRQMTWNFFYLRLSNIVNLRRSMEEVAEADGPTRSFDTVILKMSEPN